jgi:hypothetical protein
MANDDFDPIPTFFVRVAVIVIGVVGLTFLISNFSQPILLFAQGFVHNLEKNLNRSGLILQLLGIFSVLPDLLEKKQEEIWEKRLALFGTKLNRDNFSFMNLMRTITFTFIGRAEGLIGFVIYVSNIISFVTIHILIFFTFPWALGSTYKPMLLLSTALFLGAYSWLISEILFRRFHPEDDVAWSFAVRILRAFMFLACGGVFVFFPVLIISLPIAYLLKWSSRHSLRFVFITVTFPFILIGTLCQLVASFL